MWVFLYFLQAYWVTTLQGRKKYKKPNVALYVIDKLSTWFKEESAAAKKEKRDVQLYHKVSVALFIPTPKDNQIPNSLIKLYCKLGKLDLASHITNEVFQIKPMY